MTLALPGGTGIHRRTLRQLAGEVARHRMAERGLSPVSGLGAQAVLTRIVFEARREGKLGYFEPVSHLPGFTRALGRTLSDLRMARVAAAELGEGGPGRDLALLLSAYEAEMGRWALADFADVLRFATLAAGERQHRWSNLPVALLDAPIETPAEREFFEAIASQSPALLIAISSHEVSSDRQAAENLDPPEPTGELDALRRNLFGEGGQPWQSAEPRQFEIFSAPGEGLEAAEIARRILALAKSGVRFDEIAILLRAPERYQPMVEEGLRRASIPAYFSRGTSRPDPAGRAFLSLLACASEKVSASRFAEYLSLGELPREAKPASWTPPEDEILSGQLPLSFEAPEPESLVEHVDAPWAWERLLVDAAVINGVDRWERRLKGLEAEIELQLRSLPDAGEEDTRRSALERKLARLGNLQRFALPIVRLLHALPQGANWQQWNEHLGILARTALRDPEGILAVLAELAPMSEVGPVTLEEVSAVFSDRLGTLRREPLKRPWGAVFVGSIEEARGRDFRIVFLPGLAEGLFPQKSAEDPLLLDALRRAVGDLPLREDQVQQERTLLRVAAGAARERLIASYPRMDVSAARPRVPSFYALELPRAIHGALPEIQEFEKQARDAAPARLNRPGPHALAAAIDDAEYDLVAIESARQPGASARHLIEANPHLARSLRGRWARWRPSWREADGLITTNPAALDALATQRLLERSWSPSMLERFSVCPYQFALRGILRLEPREDAGPIEQLDPRTRGSLFHAIQFALFGDLKAAGLLPLHHDNLPRILKRADAVLDRVAAEYRERLAPAIPRVWASEIEDLRTDLRGWLQHAARDDYEWEPVRFEFAFGLRDRQGRDSASTPEEVTLAEGVRLRGSIDLVERHATGALRVTDHKTGKAPERIPHWTGGGKHLQPLLYALAAEQLLETPVGAGRLFYATQRGGYRQMQVNVTPQARQAVAMLLNRLDGFIAGGFLPPYPDKDACGICDYRAVCGPYEEERTSKKRRDDDRLEPLIEIRGMA